MHANDPAIDDGIALNVLGAFHLSHPDALGLAHRELPSPAGHDARYLHYYCPTGMLFIPCRGGISHNEAESITPLQACSGARVLADVLVRLADAQ